MTTIVALDCESNGLHGPIFCAAASVQVDGEEATTWRARCPIHGPVDEFVFDNILPAIEAVPEDCDSGVELVAQWRRMYRRWEADLGPTLVVCHVPWPVEARFLWDAHRDAPFSGPYPLVDIASSLIPLVGWSAACDLDAWLDSVNAPRLRGSAHDPLYDARRAAQAYWILTSGKG